MFAIIPIKITVAKLTATNVAASSYTTWTMGTTYSPSAYVVSPHADGSLHEYQLLPPIEDYVTSTNQPPATYSVTRREKMVASPSTDGRYKSYWLDLGPCNRWAMFSNRSRAQTYRATDITVTVTPGELFNSLALLNLDADTISVTVTDPVEGVVYSYSASLMDLSGIIDFYEWFFAPPTTTGDVVLTDLPAYPSATITVVATNTGETARIGEMVVGKILPVGVLLYGSKIDINDYSVKEFDDFGIATIDPRPYHRTCSYDCIIETPKINALAKSLATISAAPAVFVGHENNPETILFGLMTDFAVVLSGPTRSSCSIQVEEIA